MNQHKYLRYWTIVVPLLSWLFYFGSFIFSSGYYSILLTALLLGSVLTAVYHSEVLAHQLGEPFGTLLLAFAITVIEVGLIISCLEPKVWRLSLWQEILFLQQLCSSLMELSVSVLLLDQ